MTSQWYAIRVVTQRAGKVTASLTEQGVPTFAPHERVNRKIGREMTQHDRPLFPGYLFVLCAEWQISAVRHIAGVTGFVCYLDRGIPTPAAFPLKLILGMQAEERAGVYDRTWARPNAYRPRKGDAVKIAAGPYLGFVAKVLSVQVGQRAKLLIEGFDQPRRKTMDFAHLRAA